jgi:hypothetical protein
MFEREFRFKGEGPFETSLGLSLMTIGLVSLRASI